MVKEAPEVNTVIDECKSLVIYMKRAELVSRLLKTSIQCNDTRWNTRLLMMKSVKSQYNDIYNSLLEKNGSHRYF